MSVPVFASFALLQSGLSGIAPMVFTYGAIFAIFYFILIRPQQKQRRDHDLLVKSLKKGDEVVTAGGVVGEVVHIAQQSKDGAPVVTMEDRVTIKSADSRMVIERGKITRVVSGSAGAA
ncbi:MAG: preprotein translocase subunit YajC [Gemmatimonadota bacterium]|nr:preprotein translocase subunit YajC [Gemmatimonadota bacterium]